VLPVLSTDLYVDYPQKRGVLRGTRIDVLPGEIVALVGQSGSGKSTLALSVLQLLDMTAAQVRGSVLLLGQDLTKLTERQLRHIRGRLVSLVPQSPAAALNPALRIGTQLHEAWRAHSSLPWSGQQEHLVHLMSSAGLPAEPSFMRRYPTQVSVGQAQRLLLVMALLHAPTLLIADEPTSALDLITQRDVLQLIAGVRREHGMSVLFISHDLAAVATVCDRVAILHNGVIVETAPVRQVLTAPQHPYTRQLVDALPKWM
jgi:ABC-type glutathione transport system ATPase component